MDAQKRTKILLVRHGECAENREGVFRGRRDVPLSDRGRSQAELLAEEISRSFAPSALFSSPLQRARDTAQAIGQRAGIPVVERSGFTNMALGPWEGHAKMFIRETYPEEWSLWINNPERLVLEGAETLDDVQRRAYANLEHLVRSHEGETFVVVSHRAVLKPLLAACLGIQAPSFWRLHLDTASYSVLVHEKVRGYTCTLLNQTRHLPDLVSEWN